MTFLYKIKARKIELFVASCTKFAAAIRRVFIFYLKAHIFLGWTPLRVHPPPRPSFQCPHPDKKGTNLLLFRFCIHLHTRQNLKLICRRVRGNNWDMDAHAHMTYQAPTLNLHSPTLLWFLQNSTDYLMLAQSWKFKFSWEWPGKKDWRFPPNLKPHWGTTPPHPTPAPIRPI